MASGVHPSLYANSYHQIKLSKFNITRRYQILIISDGLLNVKEFKWDRSFANENVNG